MKSKISRAFKDEINSISNDDFKTDLFEFLDICPDYLVHISASSSKKYHQGDTHYWNGMIIHVRRCIAFIEAFVSMLNIDDDDRNILVAAAICHDIYKRGIIESEHTDCNHPVYIYSKIIKEHYYLRKKQIWLDLACICLLHMGRWTPENIPKIRMSRRIKKLSKIMHMADYLASRKEIYETMSTTRQFLKTVKDIIRIGV